VVALAEKVELTAIAGVNQCPQRPPRGRFIPILPPKVFAA
jgi:hypothetical protein